MASNLALRYLSVSRYPDFIIFGAAKSGTSTLFNYLRNDPNIFLPSVKEPEFYSLAVKFYNERDWYESLFAPASEGQLAGEGSQTYSMWPHFPQVPERIAADIPNVKLIYIMRDPIERAYSFYLQLVKMGQITQQDFTVKRTFEECLFPERYPDRSSHESFMGPLATVFPDTPSLFLDPSDYAAQLQRYLGVFPREQIHLMIFEKLLDDYVPQLNSLYGFLGLPKHVDMPSLEAAKSNISRDYFASAGAMDRIMKIKRRPLLAKASALVPGVIRRLGKRVLLSRSSRASEVQKSKPPQMLDETRRWLQDYFSHRLDEFEELTGLDTTVWREKWV